MGYRLREVFKNKFIIGASGIVIYTILAAMVMAIFSMSYFEGDHLRYTDDIDKNNENYVQVSESDARYFTLITFYTIGYGDIIPFDKQAKDIVLNECILALIINSLGFGFILYLFIRRPKDIVFSKCMLVTIMDNNLCFVPRVLNYGSDLVNVTVVCELLYLIESVKSGEVVRRRLEKRNNFGSMDKTWESTFEIDEKWVSILKQLMIVAEEINYDTDMIGIRVSISAFDKGNGEMISSSRDYTLRDVVFGDCYERVTSWEQVYRPLDHKYRNFNKYKGNHRIKELFEDLLIN